MRIFWKCVGGFILVQNLFFNLKIVILYNLNNKIKHFLPIGICDHMVGKQILEQQKLLRKFHLLIREIFLKLECQKAIIYQWNYI